LREKNIFPPIGYFGARRFSFYPSAVAMVFVFMMLPLHVVDTVLVFKKDADNAKTPGYEHMDDFERVGIGAVTALVMLYHCWVGLQNFKLCGMLRPLTAHQLRQLYEMPPTCGCL
jgi:hypothetical protein